MSKAEDGWVWRGLVHLILLRPFLKLFLGVNIAGKDNLAHVDQFVIIANHNSHLDILLLCYLLPVGHLRRTHPVADRTYFTRSRFVFWLADALFRPIWIARGEASRQEDALARMDATIASGRNLIVFPEGTRGRPGEVLHFKSGIGRLIVRHPDLPIVPVFLTGPERALPKASSLLLPFWNNVIVGPPQRYTGSHREITRRLEAILQELSRSESARRHRRKPHDKQRVKHIGFLGVDGSGKSTASAMVAEALSLSSRVCLVSDKLTFFERGQAREMQPLFTERIRRAVGGHAKKAKSLRLYKIPKLAELLLRDQLLREVRRWYAPEIIVLDGSPLLNLLAWAVLYEEEPLDNTTLSMALEILTGQRESGHAEPIFHRFPELALMKRFRLTKMNLPDIVVLIDVPAAEACRRIAARGERRQVHETEDKLGRLRESYGRLCEVVRSDWRVPTLILDGAQHRDLVVQEALGFIRQTLAAGD